MQISRDNMRGQRQRRQVEGGEEGTTISTIKKNGTSTLIPNTLFTSKSAHLPLCGSIAFKTGPCKLGRQPLLVCHAITEQQNVSSDGGKKGLGNQDAQDSIWGIINGDALMDEHTT